MALTDITLPIELKKLNVAAIEIANAYDKKIQEAAEAAQEAITAAENVAKESTDKELADAKAQIADLTKQLSEGAAILAEHQKISDELASRAEAAMATGDVAALPAIIADAKVYGEAREKKKLLEEAAALESQAAEIAAKAVEVKAKAASI